MNKTVKTIAWICLVLGLLGLAVDAVVIVGGRMAANQMQEAIAAGELPTDGFPFSEKGEFDAEARETWREEHGDALFNPDERPDGKGGRNALNFGRNSGPDRNNGLSGFRSMRFGLPLFLLAMGPVLTVVGAVILIVNREPSKKTPVKAKAKK